MFEFDSLWLRDVLVAAFLDERCRAESGKPVDHAQVSAAAGRMNTPSIWSWRASLRSK
jgi:hypothetical protein